MKRLLLRVALEPTTQNIMVDVGNNGNTREFKTTILLRKERSYVLGTDGNGTRFLSIPGPGIGFLDESESIMKGVLLDLARDITTKDIIVGLESKGVIKEFTRHNGTGSVKEVTEGDTANVPPSVDASSLSVIMGGVTVLEGSAITGHILYEGKGRVIDYRDFYNGEARIWGWP